MTGQVLYPSGNLPLERLPKNISSTKCFSAWLSVYVDYAAQRVSQKQMSRLSLLARPSCFFNSLSAFVLFTNGKNYSVIPFKTKYTKSLQRWGTIEVEREGWTGAVFHSQEEKCSYKNWGHLLVLLQPSRTLLVPRCWMVTVSVPGDLIHRSWGTSEFWSRGDVAISGCLHWVTGQMTAYMLPRRSVCLAFHTRAVLLPGPSPCHIGIPGVWG